AGQWPFMPVIDRCCSSRAWMSRLDHVLLGRALPGVPPRGWAGTGRQGAGRVHPAGPFTGLAPAQVTRSAAARPPGGQADQEPGSCPRVRCMVVALPSALVMLTETCCPGCRPARTAASVSVSGVAVPLTAVMTSPGRRPASAAGPPGVTAAMLTPAGWPPDPMTVCGWPPGAAGGGWVTGPVLMICPAIWVTMWEGMANPIPGAAPPPSCWSVAASVGMPTTWLARFTRAPPLLPGLMAAEVWITSGKVAPGDPLPCGSDTVRPTAGTIPSVTLLARPSGLPMASTMSPTRSFDESPK